MAEDSGRKYARGVEEIVDDLRHEFIDELQEDLKILQIKLEEVRNERRDIKEVAADIQKMAILMRGQAENLGLHLISIVAHRMEDYLADVKEFPPRIRDDLVKFADVLSDLVENRIPPDTEARKLVRDLPPKVGFNVGDIAVRDVEIMLVMLHGIATRFVERELQQCGYRTTTVTSPFAAIPLVVSTRPDLVMVSAVMPDLSGVDLAIGLASMPETRNIPVTLITSLDPEDDYLKLLPQHVPVILKGPSFGDDLADALDRLFLL